MIGYPASSSQSQGLAELFVSPGDLIHLNTENAFEWWEAIENGKSKAGWRFAVAKYVRKHLKAFVVHDDCSITAFRYECGLTFVRKNGIPN
jgi:hypothetical protein